MKIITKREKDLRELREEKIGHMGREKGEREIKRRKENLPNEWGKAKVRRKRKI